MKKYFILLFMALLCVPAFAKEIKTIVVSTEPPMHCASCENRIMEALRFEKGIKDVKTSVADQKVEIKYDADKTNPEAIFKALEKGGYKATEKSATKSSCSSQSSCCGKCSEK